MFSATLINFCTCEFLTGLIRFFIQLRAPKWPGQMGPLFVLVCPCFRESVIVTRKIVSFLCVCRLDNILLKNVIYFLFFLIKFQNGAHLKKWLFWTYFSHFFWSPRKTQNFLQHISLLHALNYGFIMHGLSLMWFLVLILFRAILEQSIHNKMMNKISVEMSTTDIYLH